MTLEATITKLMYLLGTCGCWGPAEETIPPYMTGSTRR